LKRLVYFQWQVVLTIVGTLIIASGIVYLLEKYNPFYTTGGNKKRSSKAHTCRQFGNTMQTYSGAICCLFASLFNEGK